MLRERRTRPSAERERPSRSTNLVSRAPGTRHPAPSTAHGTQHPGTAPGSPNAARHPARRPEHGTAPGTRHGTRHSARHPALGTPPGTQHPARALSTSTSTQHPARSTQHPRGLYNLSVHRFFAPALDPGDETVALPREEAEHLTRVLRMGVGDTVAVFDGRGHEFLARVATAVRRDVRVQLVSRPEAAA